MFFVSVVWIFVVGMLVDSVSEIFCVVVGNVDSEVVMICLFVSVRIWLRLSLNMIVCFGRFVFFVMVGCSLLM